MPRISAPSAAFVGTTWNPARCAGTAVVIATPLFPAQSITGQWPTVANEGPEGQPGLVAPAVSWPGAAVIACGCRYGENHDRSHRDFRDRALGAAAAHIFERRL